MTSRKPSWTVFLTIGFLVASADVRAHDGLESPQDRGATAREVPVAARVAGTSPVDLLGDPLPKYARSRFGTARFHAGGSIGLAIYTPDGTSLVTLGNGVIHVWDARTGQITREIGDGDIDFREIALSPDGTTLATLEHPARLRLWSLASLKEQRRWHAANDENAECMRFSPDSHTVAVGVTRIDREAKRYEKFVDLWDTSAPTERRRRIVGDWLWLKDLRFSPDGKMLATASHDTQVDSAGQKVGPERGSTRIWDVATGRERKRLAVEGAHVQSLTFSPDGRLLAAGVTDGTIRFYNVASGDEQTPRIGDPPAPGEAGPDKAPSRLQVMGCLAFSPDGKTLASGATGPDGRGDFSVVDIHLWDVLQKRELRCIPANQQCVVSLSFSPDGKTIASTGAESAVLFWDVASGHEAFPQPGHRSAIRALVISPADGTVFTGGYDGTIRRWEPGSGRELGIIARFASPPDALAVCPDGKTLLVGGGMGGRFVLWSVADRRELRRFPRVVEGNPVRHFAFSPDGQSVASEGRIWNTQTGRVVVNLRSTDHENRANTNFFPVFYSSTGKQLITTEREGARIWDVASGKETRWAVREKIHFDRVAISSDSRLLATGGVVGHFRGAAIDPTIHVWDLASGKEIAALHGHTESTNGLSFSPDGRLLASCSGNYRSNKDATVRIWEIVSGRQLRQFAGHRGSVNAVAFSSDGDSVVSGSEDGTGLVWDVSHIR